MPSWLFWLMSMELTVVSWGDVRTQKIPNFWSLFNLVVFIVLLFILPKIYVFRGDTFLYSVVFLLVGFLLFLMRIMGGGDSKFLCTFFLLIPAALQPIALVNLLVSTVLIGGFMFLTNMVKHHEKIVAALKVKNMQAVRECFGTKFSFAPVVLLAWLWLGWEQKLLTW